MLKIVRLSCDDAGNCNRGCHNYYWPRTCIAEFVSVWAIQFSCNNFDLMNGLEAALQRWGLVAEVRRLQPKYPEVGFAVKMQRAKQQLAPIYLEEQLNRFLDRQNGHGVSVEVG